MDTRPLEITTFGHRLNLQRIEFPPRQPEPAVQWRSGASLTRAPERHQGWLLQVPGLAKPRFFETRARAMCAHDRLTALLQARSYLWVDGGGNLCDSRRDHKVLRAGYRHFHSRIANGRQLRATLRALPFTGAGEFCYFTTSDNFIVCPHCAVEKFKEITLALTYDLPEPDLRIIACDLNYESDDGEEVTCDHCQRVVPAMKGADGLAVQPIRQRAIQEA